VRTEFTTIAGSNVPDLPVFVHVMVTVASHGSAHGDTGVITILVAVICVGGGCTVYIWHAIDIVYILHNLTIDN
jgi:hypothetical protein